MATRRPYSRGKGHLGKLTRPPPHTDRLYVGSLNFALTSDDLREVFQPFGELETVELHRDPVTGKSKGYCFVK